MICQGLIADIHSALTGRAPTLQESRQSGRKSWVFSSRATAQGLGGEQVDSATQATQEHAPARLAGCVRLPASSCGQQGPFGPGERAAQLSQTCGGHPRERPPRLQGRPIQHWHLFLASARVRAVAPVRCCPALTIPEAEAHRALRVRTRPSGEQPPPSWCRPQALHVSQPASLRHDRPWLLAPDTGGPGQPHPTGGTVPWHRVPLGMARLAALHLPRRCPPRAWGSLVVGLRQDPVHPGPVLLWQADGALRVRAPAHDRLVLLPAGAPDRPRITAAGGAPGARLAGGQRRAGLAHRLWGLVHGSWLADPGRSLPAPAALREQAWSSRRPAHHGARSSAWSQARSIPIWSRQQVRPGRGRGLAPG